MRIWGVDFDLLTRREEPDWALYYRNAKVVLLGNSGVGKTALAQRLVEYQHRPTERMKTMPPATQPSMGAEVRVLYQDRLRAPDGHEEVREAMLWDPPGEMITRLSDQLKTGDMAVALFLFDPLVKDVREQVVRWHQELQQAQHAHGTRANLKKFLVETRTDLKTHTITAGVPPLLREFGFDGYFRTSAVSGEGVQELMSAIRDAVDWESLPSLVTSRLFESVRNFIDEVKQTGQTLISVGELSKLFEKSVKTESKLERDEFEAALRGLERLELLRLLDFGGLILLRPEALDIVTYGIIEQADEQGRCPEDSI